MHTEQSIEQVIATYTTTVYGVALTHTASRADADDVFQEVFTAYWRSKPLVSSEEHRKAWLIRTTLNFCLKATQSSWAKKTVYVEGAQAEGVQAEGRQRAARWVEDEDTILQCEASFEHQRGAAELPAADFPFQTEQQTALYEVIRSLPTAYRSAIQLFYFEDLSVAQMALLLGEEQGTIKTRLSRARVQMREKLKRGAKDD